MSVCISAGYITSIFPAKRKPSGEEICAWLPREKVKRAQESAAHMTIAPQSTAHSMVSAATLHSTALLTATKPATGEATLKRYTRLRRNGDELARYHYSNHHARSRLFAAFHGGTLSTADPY